MSSESEEKAGYNFTGKYVINLKIKQQTKRKLYFVVSLYMGGL